MLEDVLLIALSTPACPCGRSTRQAVEGRSASARAARASRSGRSAEAPLLPAGRLVVADDTAALAVLFGELARVTRRAPDARLTLFAVQVPGVPTLYAEEALWCVSGALEAG